jgi:hypothetical protein
MSNSAEANDRALAVVKQHSAQLMEHFDSVQIICTKYDGDTTVRLSWGGGNHYARTGSVIEWLDSQTDTEDQDDEQRPRS